MSMTRKNGGTINAVSLHDAAATGSTNRLFYRIYYSVTSIPANGSMPNAGDQVLGIGYFDPSSTSLSCTIAVLGFLLNAASSFFVYLGFQSGTGIGTNVLQEGALTVSET